jgi:hypothetical protein
MCQKEASSHLCHTLILCLLAIFLNGKNLNEQIDNKNAAKIGKGKRF